MAEHSDASRNAMWQLIFLTVLIVAGYLCLRTLRFTRSGLNLAFVCLFLLLPFLAIRPVLRLRRRPKIFTTISLTPLLALSLLILFFTVAFDIPAALAHRELSHELSSVHEEHYSVHLLWEETAGGAVGPHGVGLEQRMFILPGLYVVKHIDYFDGVLDGSLSVVGPDQVKVHIRESYSHPEIDKVYSLKQRVYF